jgi:Zn-dependent peptidase ImmA (M78 family)
MTISEPTATGCTLKQLHNYALKIGQHHHIYRNGVADMKKLLAALGGNTIIHDTHTSLTVYGKNNFTINLPNLTSSITDRFTIAQQIGHYLLHYRYWNLDSSPHEPYTFERSAMDNKAEEVKSFGVALLLPASMFKVVSLALHENEYAIADHFRVPPRIITIRNFQLNRI